ncbi:MAG: hypothetical protein EA398_04740 [Deltaproteobacteria bacterium]|nr:MAG: hypothetical protein EA398_04740 [Deltaproteobacteria bacterium]
MKTPPMLSALLLLVLLPAGCAPFQIDTPDEMVALQEPRRSAYAYRATSVDGVVLGVRTVRAGDNQATPLADLAFWSDAIATMLRDERGYALLDTADIRSADGTPGRALHFGREHDGRQFRYDLHLYVGRRYIHILEVGGLDETLDARREAVDEALSGYRIRR